MSDEAVFDFGLHAGKRPSEVPIGYVRWCLGQLSIIRRDPRLTVAMLKTLRRWCDVELMAYADDGFR